MPTRFSDLSRIVLLVLLFLPACGDSVKRYPVQGTIFRKEVPVAGAQVVFHPDGELSGNERPAGFTDDQGRFSLAVQSKGSGAIPGNYRVTILWIPRITDIRGETVEDGKDRLGSRYAMSATTPLKATVEPKVNEALHFELE